MLSDDFYIGDIVKLTCKDNAVFRGELMQFAPTYILLDGLGFPIEDIKEMELL